MAIERTTHIGQGTTIVGKVHGTGDIEVAGKVEGTLDVDGDITLADTARIKSPVRGSRVTVRGAVSGDISASQAIVLEEGARVVGDLSAPSIGIRPGGLLRGHVSTEGAGPAPRVRAERAAATPARTAAPARAVAPVRRPAPPPRKVVEPVVEVEPTPSPLTRGRAGRAARQAPAPVMPALQRGAKGALKKKSAR